MIDPEGSGPDWEVSDDWPTAPSGRNWIFCPVCNHRIDDHGLEGCEIELSAGTHGPRWCPCAHCLSEVVYDLMDTKPTEKEIALQTESRVAREHLESELRIATAGAAFHKVVVKERDLAWAEIEQLKTMLTADPTENEIKDAMLAVHRELASVWMTVVNALEGDQTQYESLLRGIAKAALETMKEARR